MKPMEIEKQSFAIIEKELTTQIPPQYKPIVKRVIHTTADFSYETNMVFSEGVVDKALEAIQKGTDIVTDTNMAGAGISHKMAERFAFHCTAIWQMKRWQRKRRRVKLPARQSAWKKQQSRIRAVLW